MSLTVLLFLLPLQTLLRDFCLALACNCAGVSGTTGVGVGVASRLLALHPMTAHRRMTLLIIAAPVGVCVQAFLQARDPLFVVRDD